MYRTKLLAKSILSNLGFNPKRLAFSLRALPLYVRDLVRALREWDSARVPISFWSPQLADRYESSGSILRHYTLQDLYVARKIHDAAPELHVDVGSRLDGFICHLASFREVEVLDIRPQDSRIPGVTFGVSDLMRVDEARRGATPSLSCLHALEHFGLGRYGDPLDERGHEKGLEGLRALLATGGTLYLSVPVGREMIHFNSHRVFGLRSFAALLDEKGFELNEVAFIDDKGDLTVENAVSDRLAALTDAQDYGLGIFTLTKRG